MCLLNQSSYIKFGKFSQILIKFPLIWYMVLICRPNIGIKFVVQAKQSTFLCPSPYNTGIDKPEGLAWALVAYCSAAMSSFSIASSGLDLADFPSGSLMSLAGPLWAAAHPP